MSETLFYALDPGASTHADAEHQAQQLIYDAWEMVHARDRVELAKQALALWSDCADAWLILAEDEAKTLTQACECYRQAVAAGERALGEQAFVDDVGHFWSLLATRPYMRARQGLARLLKEMGRTDEAAGHLREMLRLNPGDNQGNRYHLLHLLLAAGRDDETAELLHEYAGDSLAEWVYGRALLAYRQHGVSVKADRLLQAALECNAFVPAYLLGRRRLPRQLPATIGFGDNNEAIAYAADYKLIWKQTSGALVWLKSGLGKQTS